VVFSNGETDFCRRKRQGYKAKGKVIGREKRKGKREKGKGKKEAGAS
jgi:hypothetical protein